MKKIVWLTLAVFVIVLFSGCVITRPSMAPPPAKKEIRPHKPGPKYIWITGHWKWTGAKYVWIPGHWVKARPGKIWVPGQWKKKGHTWIWIPGHWKKKKR